MSPSRTGLAARAARCECPPRARPFPAPLACECQGERTSRRQGLAEGEGFEPSIRLPVYTLSKRAPSATRPSLRQRGIGCAAPCARHGALYVAMLFAAGNRSSRGRAPAACRLRHNRREAAQKPVCPLAEPCGVKTGVRSVHSPHPLRLGATALGGERRKEKSGPGPGAVAASRCLGALALSAHTKRSAHHKTSALDALLLTKFWNADSNRTDR